MTKSTKNAAPFDDTRLARHIEMALSVEKPGGLLPDTLYKISKRIFSPTLIDADKIPDKPCLFVSNHSLLALDGMVLLPTLFNELKRYPRGMGDRFLWTESTEKFLIQNGCILGHPKVCSALMENGIDLLVFPGGAHEALKRADQKYSLQWKQRYGFVKLAAKHGYTIVPIAQVGPDEFYDHLMEGEDLPNSAIGQLLKRFGLITEDTRPDLLPPIPIGSLGTMLPKPQRCYFQFGDPVDLSKFKDKEISEEKVHAIRGEVADQIETMLADLLIKRARVKDQDGFFRRLLTL